MFSALTMSACATQESPQVTELEQELAAAQQENMTLEEQVANLIGEVAGSMDRDQKGERAAAGGSHRTRRPHCSHASAGAPGTRTQTPSGGASGVAGGCPVA